MQHSRRTVVLRNHVLISVLRHRSLSLTLTSIHRRLQVSEIKGEWLVEIAPHYYSKKDILDDGRKLPKGKGRAAMDAH